MTVYPGPGTGSTALIASMDDERGLTISVYRDHDGIRIDAGGTEIMLSTASIDAMTGSIHALISLLHEASTEAILWGLSHE